MGIWSDLLKRAKLRQQSSDKPSEAPQLPGGTRARGDIWANTYSGLGTAQYDPRVKRSTTRPTTSPADLR